MGELERSLPGSPEAFPFSDFSQTFSAAAAGFFDFFPLLQLFLEVCWKLVLPRHSNSSSKTQVLLINLKRVWKPLPVFASGRMAFDLLQLFELFQVKRVAIVVNKPAS